MTVEFRCGHCKNTRDACPDTGLCVNAPAVREFVALDITAAIEHAGKAAKAFAAGIPEARR
jgi:hypothetical protein